MYIYVCVLFTILEHGWLVAVEDWCIRTHALFVVFFVDGKIVLLFELLQWSLATFALDSKDELIISTSLHANWHGTGII